MLSFIVITMNRKEKLRRCLQSVQAQQGITSEVIVLDNGSNDATAEMVSADFPNVSLIASEENLGVGGGRNRAAEQAKGDLLVFLDDDSYAPDPAAMARIATYFDGEDAVDSLVFTITEANGAVFKNYIPRQDKRLLPEDSSAACLTGGACVIKREVFDRLKGYWPLLNPYGYEDRDFMFRFLQAGYQAIWTRQIEVVHDKEEDPSLNPKWLIYMLPHHSWVALRHLPWRYVVSYIVHGWPYFFVKAVRHGLLWSYCCSIGRFFRYLPAVLRTRKPLSRDVLKYCRTHSGRLRY